MDEQSKLGEIKKYQILALQNIQISQNTHNMLKQQRIQQNIEALKNKNKPTN